jgi:hypothetical protein
MHPARAAGSRSAYLLSIAGCSLSLCACQPLSPIPVSGHYEGNLILRQGDRLAESPVTAEIPELHAGELSIPLKNLDGSDRSPVRLGRIRRDSLTLAISELGGATLAARMNDGCYTSRDAGITVRLCPAREEVLIEASDASGKPLYSLSLDHFATGAAPALEPARAYSLADAMNRALTLDFGTRIEFEHVMQARHQAANAYLKLLPHLGGGSILALAAAPTVVGLLGAVGDLVPFLFPSRWIQAREARLASEAEQDALILMRGDAGVQLEGMAYAFARDVGIQRDYAAAITEVDEARQQIAKSEAAGGYPAGSADLLATLLIQLQSDADDLDLTVSEEKMSLAQAMGFVNPDAVTDLSVPEESVPLDAAKELDPASLMAEAQDRSFELRQMDWLIRAAESARRATYFSWLDPSGDPSVELGAGLGQAVAVATSQVAELRVAREQTASILLQKVDATVAEFNDSLDDHERSGRYFALQDTRVSRLLAALAAGQPVQMYDLITALSDHLAARLGLRNSDAVYRISLAKLDRLLLRGYYAHLSGVAFAF